MRANVAPTDGDWWRYLAARPELTEANFWVPGARKTYGLPPGSPVLFKSKKSDGNRLVGGGWLAGYLVLAVSEAWRNFGQQNGCETFEALWQKLDAYRRRNNAPSESDPLVGCVMLRDTVFFDARAALPAPPDFPSNNPGPKGYELGGGDSVEVDAAVGQLLGLRPAAASNIDTMWHHDGPMFGSARPVVPRLGQSSFAAHVAEAYQLRCAITGAKVRPILQAAHIRPVEAQGQHRVDNGLLLRADVHIMFDQGYLGVEPNSHKLLVSKDIREVWGNGDEFYDRQGEPIRAARRRVDRPNDEYLDWHLSTKFRR